MAEHASTSTGRFCRSLSVREVAHVVDNLDAFCEASKWVQNYLAQPHPKLGRPGPVCPFAPSALAHDTVRIAVVRFKSGDRRVQIEEAIKHHLDAFLAGNGPDHQRLLHATLLLFPDVSLPEAPELIDRVKEQLKPDFIKQGLMLGEFHARNHSPGLHNPNFMPLRSPVPMLAIRHMVSTDLVFLDRPEYDAETRLTYLEAYLNVSSIPQSNREDVERKVKLLRDEIQNCVTSR